MLIFGREFRWPGDIRMLEFPDLLDDTIDLGKYYEDRRSFFTEATTFVRTIIEEVQAQNAVRHDALQHFPTMPAMSGFGESTMTQLSTDD